MDTFRISPRANSLALGTLAWATLALATLAWTSGATRGYAQTNVEAPPPSKAAPLATGAMPKTETQLDGKTGAAMPHMKSAKGKKTHHHK